MSNFIFSYSLDVIFVRGNLHYLDKLAHVQVVINCQYSVAPMCTWEDTHPHLFTRPALDDVMSQNKFTTLFLMTALEVLELLRVLVGKHCLILQSATHL